MQIPFEVFFHIHNIHKVSISLDVSYNVKAQLSPAALIPSEGLHRDISLETHREGKTRVWGLGRQSSAKHSAHMARVHILCSHSVEIHADGNSSLKTIHAKHTSKINLSMQSETTLFKQSKMNHAVSRKTVAPMRYILIE